MTQTAPRLCAVTASPLATGLAMKKPCRRVIWKPNEQAQVIRRATELLAATPRMPMHVAARRAQEEVLAPERWKRIRQHKDVERWLSSRPDSSPPLRRYPRAIKPALPDPVQPAEASAIAPSAPPEAPAPAQAIDPAIARAVAEQIAPLLAVTVAECTRQLVGALVDAIQNTGAQGSAKEVTHDSRAIPLPPRTRLPRVCVVGLINQQEHDVSAAFNGVIEFIFVKAQRTGGGGHGGAGMLTRSASSDLVIAMTDFIGHDVEASAKHLHVPFERVKGSVSALKRWLTDWLATGGRHDQSRITPGGS